MKIVYFSSFKDMIGVHEEMVILPPTILTIDHLIDYLSEQSEGHRSAFSHRSRVKVAINQTYANLESSLENALEIAFFPPVTGG
jgi:molybdopterin synthase sulfur carrier subunit